MPAPYVSPFLLPQSLSPGEWIYPRSPSPAGRPPRTAPARRRKQRARTNEVPFFFPDNSRMQEVLGSHGVHPRIVPHLLSPKRVDRKLISLAAS